MDIFEEIIAVKNAGTSAVLATVVEVIASAPGRPCAKMLIKADGSITGTIGGGAVEKKIVDEAMEIMHGTESKLLRYNLEDIGMSCGGSMGVFLEPLKNAPDLIIFGAGHIGRALSKTGKMIGFTTIVADNRPEFANKERLPWADKVLAKDYEKLLPELVLSENTYLAILTHKHIHDFEVLEYCVRQPFCYLGMIGSRNKVAKALQQLKDNGISDEAIGRIHAPIGLGIGANTPDEIAVSIAAELIAVRSGADVASLKMAKKSR